MHPDDTTVVRIPLTRGQVALVDAEDADRVLAMAPWQCTVSGYAVKNLTHGPIWLHKLIAGADGDERVDHINGDKLDCRTANLRRCGEIENRWNTPPHRDNASGYKGVERNGQRWRARIYVDGKSRTIGYFDTPEDAARARDHAARFFHGEFAWLNFPHDPIPDEPPTFRQRASQSGYRGVVQRSANCWHAKIRQSGRTVYSAYFSTAEEAAAAVADARARLTNQPDTA